MLRYYEVKGTAEIVMATTNSSCRRLRKESFTCPLRPIDVRVALDVATRHRHMLI